MNNLPYNPNDLPRELCRHYISASDEEIDAMLQSIGSEDLESLFNSLPSDVLFENAPNLPKELPYNDIFPKIQSIAQKNNLRISFLGDALQSYTVDDVVPPILDIRNLTTSYTPYQPERSQGTLISMWVYQCMISALTGFEAINSSLYDRSSAIFEALCCALRLRKKSTTLLISEGIFPQDLAVIKTLIANTQIKIDTLPLTSSGTLDLEVFKNKAQSLGPQLAGVVYTQINHFGLLEDVDSITNLIHEHNALAIAVIDPMLLATDGLKPPSEYGNNGADIIVGEGQHLALSPNFGGPGLGLFGVRHNEKTKNHVRATPGRLVGRAKDTDGRDAFVIVLSTREQHIRKEKATSNICSNQAYVATLAGAAILSRGESGMQAACLAGHTKAKNFASEVTKINGIQLAFPRTPFYNECTLELPTNPNDAIAKALAHNLHIGVNISSRDKSNRNLLKVSFSDTQSENDCLKLLSFFEGIFGPRNNDAEALPEILPQLLRTSPTNLPSISKDEIVTYYNKLGDLNISPDNTCYPLGSCTMKYNPYINDWAAGLPEFADIHPQAPIQDAQGTLEILYEIQEWFKQITGLPAVTTQPLAGAQGELVGIKLFQAYHNDRGESHRHKVFIPKTAHGTNFATAIMAGFEAADIIPLENGPDGQIDLDDFNQKLETHAQNLCGVMITNPNTCGIFESNFKLIADKVHNAGGLVYMDGANMNAIAGWVNLQKLGVDAVHNNLHKTWTIPHGGGGPGDAIVAVSQPLADYLPGIQITKSDSEFNLEHPKKAIGSFHRHFGNVAHKIRCYTYFLRLGKDGVRRMSAVAVLSARYLLEKLKPHCPILPQGTDSVPRMHEFILTLSNDDFAQLESIGLSKPTAIPRIGKTFLDFGFYAPTVAFPEPLGLMLEPTESYSKAELDRLAEAIISIYKIIHSNPKYLLSSPLTAPVKRLNEVDANRNLILSENLQQLPTLSQMQPPSLETANMSIPEIEQTLVGLLVN